MKEQEAKGLLSNSRIKTLLSKIPLFNVLRCIKMDEIMNKFLLSGDKFIPELHLTQPGFTYSACGPLKKKELEILCRQEIWILFTEMIWLST